MTESERQHVKDLRRELDMVFAARLFDMDRYGSIVNELRTIFNFRYKIFKAMTVDYSKPRCRSKRITGGRKLVE